MEINIWKMNRWKNYILMANPNPRTGLRLVFDRTVDPEVRRACKEFASWLRKDYIFPIRLPVYIKGAKYIKARDGDLVYGTFLGPDDYALEPYIRVATGDFVNIKNWEEKDNKLAGILSTIAHEITHYYQWINALELTPIGEERQASRYAQYILDEYAETREHP